MVWIQGMVVGPTNLNAQGASATTTAGFSTNTLSPESGNTISLGTYALVGGLDLSTNTLQAASGNTVTLFPYSTSFVASSIDSGGAVFNGLAFGCSSSRTTNDVGLNAAIAAAQAAGGGTVILPGGKFAVTSQVTLKSGVVLRGSGWSTLLSLSTYANGAWVIDASASSFGLRDIAIEASNGTKATSHTIFGSGAAYGLLENVSVSNTTVGACGIQFTDSHDITVRGARAFNHGQEGILFTRASSGCSNILVEGSSVSSTGRGIFFNAEVHDSAIIGNRIWGCENGIRLGFSTVSSTKSISRIRIIGNYSSDNSIDGIRLMGEHIIVSANDASRNSGAGIRTGGNGSADSGGFVYSIIQGNVCSFNSNGGISITDQLMNFLTIQGNSCDSNAGTGIIYAQQNVSTGTVEGGGVFGNTCRFNTNYGISFGSGQTYVGFTVNGNRCLNNGAQSSNGSAGIGLSQMIWSVIQGNICYDNQASKTQNFGIQTVSCTSLVVSGNIVPANQHVTSAFSLSYAQNDVGHNII